MWAVLDRNKPMLMNGIVHRVGATCYHEAQSKQLTAIPQRWAREELSDELHRLRERVAFLEAALGVKVGP